MPIQQTANRIFTGYPSQRIHPGPNLHWRAAHFAQVETELSLLFDHFNKSYFICVTSGPPDPIGMAAINLDPSDIQIRARLRKLNKTVVAQIKAANPIRECLAEPNQVPFRVHID